MIYRNPLILIISVLMLQFCSNNVIVEGEEAYLTKNYNEAIKILTSPQVDEHIRTDHVNEIIVLSYMYRGKSLYKKTKNVKSFSGNYKSSLKYLPEVASEDFKIEYSTLLTELAKAYAVAKAENKLEQEKFNKNSIKIVNMAIANDSLNAVAHELHDELKERNFNKLFKKAKNYYEKARKFDDVDMYFSAKAFLYDAAQYDPKNPEVLSLRRKIRRSTLGILNFNDGVSLAVTDKLYEKGKLVMILAVKNYKNKSVMVKPDKIEIYDLRGKSYSPDSEEMRVRELFGQKCFKSKKLDQNNPYTEGIVAFDVPKNLALSHIVLRNNGDEISRKYFQ